MSATNEPPFYDYKVMREIPFEAPPELVAYHKLVVERFDTLLPLHRAVDEARQAEMAKGWDYETSDKVYVKPHRTRLEEAAKEFEIRFKALAKVPKKLLAQYGKARDAFYYRDSNVSWSDEQLSTSGKYRLVRTKHPTGPGTWEYSKGRVYVEGQLVAEVRRNYHEFWFAFVEGHPKGDFLLCGADYQGQTIVALPSGEHVDYLPEAATKGFGFCWAHAEPSPDMRFLAVDGCIWAGPYETRIYDFSDPMTLPYKDVGPEETLSDGFHWNPDSSIGFVRERTVRKYDGKDEDNLTEEEVAALDELEKKGAKWADLWEERKEVVQTWTPKTP